MARVLDIEYLKTKQQIRAWVVADDWAAINLYFKDLVRPSSHWDELSNHLMANKEKNVWPEICKLIISTNNGNALRLIENFLVPKIPNSVHQQWFNARTPDEQLEIVTDTIDIWATQESGPNVLYTAAVMNSALVFDLCLSVGRADLWATALTKMSHEPVEWIRALVKVNKCAHDKSLWYGAIHTQYEHRSSIAKVPLDPWEVFLLQHVAWEALTYDTKKKLPFLKSLCMSQMQGIKLELKEFSLNFELQCYNTEVMDFLDTDDLILSIALLNKYNVLSENIVNLIAPEKISETYKHIYYAILMDLSIPDSMRMLQNAESINVALATESIAQSFESSIM